MFFKNQDIINIWYVLISSIKKCIEKYNICVLKILSIKY